MLTLIEIRELSRISDSVKLRSSEEVANYCMGKPLEMQTLAQEHLYCFCLDIKNNIKTAELISKGSLTTTVVHPREILKCAILSNAVSIVMVHNHPSGDLSPSMDDIEITKRIDKACNILGIELLDHIIVSRDGYYSFKQGKISKNEEDHK
jgi:DNA repair protein RadC